MTKTRILEDLGTKSPQELIEWIKEQLHLCIEWFRTCGFPIPISKRGFDSSSSTRVDRICD